MSSRGSLSSRCAVLAVAALLGTGSLASASAPAAEPARLQQRLPRDPLFAATFHFDGPGQGIAGFLRMLDRFGQAQAGQRLSADLQRIESSLGLSITDDLLRNLGPEIAVVLDLAEIDGAVLAFQSTDADALMPILGGTALVAEVRDAARVDQALRALFAYAGAEVETVDDHVRVRLPLGPFAAGPGEQQAPRRRIGLYYALRDGRLALGFSPRAVLDPLRAPVAGQRLLDGDDYARVFAKLDARPNSLTYLNLPKLQKILAESVLARAILDGQSSARPVTASFFDDTKNRIGLGSTTVAVDGGQRTTRFGPSWASLSTLVGRFAAAIATQALRSGMEEGRRERTESEILRIADACRGFSGDVGDWPGPTPGWVPVDEIAHLLEPVYIQQLPRRDAWRNPILYWSDGAVHRIVSTGSDGSMDRNWEFLDGSSALPVSTSDLVYGDGRFLVKPVPTP